MDLEQDIKNKINLGLINNDLQPIKCECGCIEFVDVIKDSMSFGILEFERNCKKCGITCGYWAHGFWMP